MGRLTVKPASGETLLDDISGLIPAYITNRKELDEAEFLNINKAFKFYFINPKNLSKFEITRESLFNVHKKMFSLVWEWAGKKRKSNKNIGIEPYKIDEEIKKLIDDYNYWIKNDSDFTEILARLHHRFVWIHPFEGGNGRWARLVTDILYFKKTKKHLNFPEDELKLRTTFRDEYLKALKESDKGNFDSLVIFFKKLTK